MDNFRPNWNKYFMNITKEISQRSNCMSAHIGAVIIKNKTIISTGYNGAPRQTKDCYERGNCLRRQLNIPSGQRYELCRSVHAEQNAIINAAREGTNLTGADIYMYGEKVHNNKKEILKVLPCFICKKMIINAGIRNLYYIDNHRIKKIHIEDWQHDWQKKDMMDDLQIYDAKY